MELFKINNIKELNTSDQYFLNVDCEFYGKNGTIVLKIGTGVKFVSIGADDKKALVYHSSFGVSDIPICILSSKVKSLVGSIVSLKNDILLNTNDGVFTFPKETSKFLVENVFEMKDPNTEIVEKTCFIRFLNDEGGTTAVTGNVYFEEINI